MPDLPADKRWALLDVVVKVSMPILMGVSAWAGMMVLDHESRLDVIEATRYTRDNAAAERRDGEEERRTISLTLSRLEILLGQMAERQTKTEQLLRDMQSRDERDRARPR